MTNRQTSILVLAGGALVALGSLLPWVTVSSGFGSASVNGIEGDGVFTLILGGVLGLIGFLAYGGGGPKIGLAVLLAGAALAFGFYELQNVQSRIGDIDSDAVRGSVGIGLYIILGGAALAMLGGVASLRAANP